MVVAALYSITDANMPGSPLSIENKGKCHTVTIRKERQTFNNYLAGSFSMLQWIAQARSQIHDTAPQTPSAPETLDTSASAPFYAVDGYVYNTARQLADALLHMQEQTFNHHVNSQRNDFSAWLIHCYSGALRELGKNIQGLSRADMLRWFADFPNKPLLPVPKPTAEEKHASAPNSAPASAPKSAGIHPPRIQLPLRTPTHTHHQEPMELHPKPLPRSPLDQVHEHRVSHFMDQLADCRAAAATDRVRAQEQFVALRTKAWRDFSDEDRKQVLPGLRDTYEFLLKAA